MDDVKIYKSCKWCGTQLSRVVWNSVFCSQSCTQGCTEHKQQTAPQEPLPVYLDRVAGECLKGKHHPNKGHEQNKLLESIYTKLSELKELYNLRKNQILYI